MDRVFVAKLNGEERSELVNKIDIEAYLLSVRVSASIGRVIASLTRVGKPKRCQNAGNFTIG